MIEPYRTKLLINVKKAKGQIDRIMDMIAKDRYCMDIAQQCNAVIGLLRQGNNAILESHLHSCGAEHLASKNKQKKGEFIKELVRVCSVANPKG